MGNTDSSPGGSSGPSGPSDNTNYWHGTNPKSEPSLRKPPSPPSASSHSNGNSRLMALQRKASSFLEEPITHKLTERGEAQVTLQESSTITSSNGREGISESRSFGSPDTDNVLRYAVSEMQGWRSHMEDKHALNPKLSTNKQQKELLKNHHLFAVFDGHGGDYASHFCGENLVETLIGQKDWHAYLKLSNSSSGYGRGNADNRSNAKGLALLKSALTSTFLELDDKLMDAQRRKRKSQLSNLEDLVFSMGGAAEHDVFEKGTADHNRVMNFDKQMPSSMPAYVPLERSGSTGVVVLMTPSHILCANAGDSRAILSKRNKGEPVLPLSFDHKPNNDVEVGRIERDGGFVRAGRVDGDLAVSRSFGDFGYKNCDRDKEDVIPDRRDPRNSFLKCKKKDHRVTVQPDILIHRREPAKDEFVVLACDGIWDRLSNKDCAELVRKLVHNEGETDVGLVCEEIIDTALELDSRDNMTCCVVLFPDVRTGHRGLSNYQGLGNSTSSSSSGGVMKRRIDRENSWGNDSTPAKRAQLRLEERKKKNRDQLAAMQQRQRIANKGGGSSTSSQAATVNVSRRQRQKTPERTRQKTPERTRPSQDSASLGGASSDYIQHRQQQGGQQQGSGGRKHKQAHSPPHDLRITSSSSRTRSSKSLRIQASQ